MTASSATHPFLLSHTPFNSKRFHRTDPVDRLSQTQRTPCPAQTRKIKSKITYTYLNPSKTASYCAFNLLNSSASASAASASEEPPAPPRPPPASTPPPPPLFIAACSSLLNSLSTF